MQPPVPMSEVGVGGWALTVASVLALLGAGVAVRIGRRLIRRSAPELIVLLDQSAAFYSRWPEDRLALVPRAELVTEAARCRRIVELLEARSTDDPRGDASRGAIDGLRAWITVLGKRIDQGTVAPSGGAYA